MIGKTEEMSFLLSKLKKSSWKIVEKIKKYSARRSQPGENFGRSQSILTISITEHPVDPVKVVAGSGCRRGSHQTVLERCLVAREARIRRRSIFLYSNLAI